MLNPELEDHTGSDLGYLNSFSIDYFVLVKNQLQILETIFIPDVSAWQPSSGHTGYNNNTTGSLYLTCIYYILPDWLRVNMLNAKAIYVRIT